jgi:hypothetical protein
MTSPRGTDEVATVKLIRTTYHEVYRAAEPLVALTERLTQDQLPEASRSAAAERLAPGYIDYIRQASLRAARLSQTIAEGVLAVYLDVRDDDIWVFHHDIEAPITLSRTALELIGRVRSAVTPNNIALGVKSYVALQHYDLDRVLKATGGRDPRVAELEGLVPALERATDREPDSRRYENSYERNEARRTIDRWRVESTAAIRYLATADIQPKGEEQAVSVFRRLSDAVHGGVLIEPMWFRPNANGRIFGFWMLQRVGTMLRFELDELRTALERNLRPEE